MLVPICNNYECEYMGTPKGFCSCQVCAHGYPKPVAMRPQTNADRIRGMTDEELAEWIADDLIEPGYNSREQTVKIWLDWLREEANKNS